MKRVLQSKLFYAEDDRFYLDGSPYTGVAFTKFEDGSLQSETELKDGLADGTSRGWFSNGQLANEATFYKGSQHGFSREYDEDGRMKEETLAEYGILIQERKWEHETLVEDYRLKEGEPDFLRLEEYRRAFVEEE